MAAKIKHIHEALTVLGELGMPNEQLNERTAICLLALLDLTKDRAWVDAQNPKLGIRAILDFARGKYKRPYAENTRETIRDESIKPLVSAGVVMHNPDDPSRAVNSPKNCYQVEPDALTLFRTFGKPTWRKMLTAYLPRRQTLADKYARHRDMARIPVRIKDGETITLSAGEHSTLIRAILEEFSPRFVPNGELIYVGDTGSKWGYFDRDLLKSLCVDVRQHGKMPDVVIYFRAKNWLILAEAVTSSGPVDGRRHAELSELFKYSTAGLVYVTAFPSRGETMRKYLSVIAWETEVWSADAPTHLIHFNGNRFLGPYSK